MTNLDVTEPRIGTYQDIARIYRVSILTVKRWKKAGLITPDVEFGSVIRFDLDRAARDLASGRRRHPSAGKPRGKRRPASPSENSKRDPEN